ncbi:MAG TPA: hypothetical protein VFO58_06235, partial [Vicinamibacterales bacterium]|nr:hypothetical protein [Vicinamibacterales bacterium]
MRRSHFSFLGSRFVFSFGVRVLVLGSGFGVLGSLAAAQAPAAVEKHIAAARAAAGTEHAGMVTRLCPASAPAATPAARGGGARRGGGPPGPPPRESWHAEPVKVFDNFYFVGMTEYSTWAITTSQG